ncbi:MAG: hypothetical protein HC794_02755 [Nitrospiraceae bacterium]|nr:hypothetical protein [Nitrospiraceae bacterium]
MTPPPPLALLLDFDGTLVPIGATPDAICVSDDLQSLMALAIERLEGRVAVISGRSLEQLDALWDKGLWPVTVAASHGLEMRHNGRLLSPPPAQIFAQLARATDARFGAHKGVVIELKSFGLGLHYRLAPSQRDALRAWADECAAEHDLVVADGTSYEYWTFGSRRPRTTRKVTMTVPVFDDFELELDWKIGRAGNAVLGGWTLAGIYTARSGRPFTVTQGGLEGATWMPNVVGDPGGQETVDSWFNASAYQRVAVGTFGNLFTSLGVNKDLAGSHRVVNHASVVPWIGTHLAEILCVQEDRVVANDNTVRYQGRSLQIPSDTHRFHYVKVRVRVHAYPDGTLAVFHGPRCLARYTAEGQLINPDATIVRRKDPTPRSRARPIVAPGTSVCVR